MTRKTLLKLAAATSLFGLLSVTAMADEKTLQLYNWGNYTSPELLAKFEKETGIKVVVTDYDSNDTALAKIKAGGHGFDMVVPSANYVPIFISEGLLMETGAPGMPNFKNMDPRWVDVPFDPGRKFTIPWQWGTTGVTVNTSIYKGDINTWDILFKTPEELKGKVNLLPEMSDVMGAALMYVGSEPCSADKEALKKARDLLVEAKPNWLSIDYGNVEKYIKLDLAAGMNWNGASFRSRLGNKDVQFGYPKEGYITWMDSVGILKDAKNPEGAKAFINFIMAPENAAMISAFARYANGIKGSEAFMPEDMKTAPEIVIPAAADGKGKFSLACPPEVQEMYSRIWTEVTK
jgi:spermidine/putrescine transport system substrate-binding protein